MLPISLFAYSISTAFIFDSCRHRLPIAQAEAIHPETPNMKSLGVQVSVVYDYKRRNLGKGPEPIVILVPIKVLMPGVRLHRKALL